MTPKQLASIHAAKKAAGLNDPQWRMLLANVAGVDSSKHLDNAGMEKVMAVIEEMRDGAGSPGGDPHYWRRRAERQQSHASSRAIEHLRELAAHTEYSLEAMCRRLTNGRTDNPEELTPHEAWQVTEAYKAICDRNGLESQSELPYATQREAYNPASPQPDDEPQLVALDDDIPF